MERPLALWIKRNRKARDWKVEELSRRLTDAGYDASPVTIRGWESQRGGNPSARNVEAMERIFGEPAPMERRDRDALARVADVLERLARLEELTVEVARIAGEVEALRIKVGGDHVATRHDQDRADG